jgi:hypothetical protein
MKNNKSVGIIYIMFRLGAPKGANAMFRKGISTAMKASKSLGGAGKALSGAVKTGVAVGNAALANPVVRAAVAASPEATQALQFANKAAGAASGAASILKAGSTLINPAQYQKVVGPGGKVNPQAVGANIGKGLERAKAIAGKAESLYQYVQ